MMLLVGAAQRLGHPALGWIIPGAIFVLSFVLTWMVYKHFSRRSLE
ncbi:MAG: hypothetical protein ACRD5G_14915 [Candidatus Acidiferrales bacterium]